MKIAICDDSPDCTGALLELIRTHNTNSEYIFTFNSAEDLLCSAEKFDIVFLDIELGSANGLETANALRIKIPDIIIVFVSAHKEYVFDSFKCEALHFLVKPINPDEFQDVFDRALNKYSSLHQFYTVCWRGCRKNLRISDITYIESINRHLVVRTADGEEHCHIGKISETAEKLASHGFLLVHQSFLVNMANIISFGSTEITLSTGNRIPIAGRKRHDALKLYDKYLQRLKW